MGGKGEMESGGNTEREVEMVEGGRGDYREEGIRIGSGRR